MSQIPHADPGKLCPFHKLDMAKVCHKCPLWVKIVGRHPQTDAPVDQWNCSFAWFPFLMIENSNMQRQTGAAVESFRNEMVKATNQPVEIMLPVPPGMPLLRKE